MAGRKQTTTTTLGRLALTRSFIENNGFLKRFLARFLSEQQDIDDVVQETYLRAYSAVANKELEQPKAFLFRIARNIALNELTRKSRQITDYIEDCHPSFDGGEQPSAEMEVEAQQALGVYCEAVATLPEKCRRVYLLRKIHGLSHQEIATRMGLSLSSVEKYLRQGLLECRSYIRKREEPVGALTDPHPVLLAEQKGKR